VAAAGAIAAAGLGGASLLVPASVSARVDPLSIIRRQIHKPNMLVVLDTSGSLTGVPGGSFDDNTEVGVDCDDGVNCRGGAANGTCTQSIKSCSSDAQCRSATCKVDRMACAANADCAPQAGRCSVTTCDSRGLNCQRAPCFDEDDCPAAPGTCAYSRDSCSTSDRCSSRPRCQYGNANCSLGGSCSPYGHCLGSTGQSTSQVCSQDNDCPLRSSGTCVFGGGSCTSASSCAVKLCPDRATTCTASSQCGTCSRGTSRRGTYCQSDSDCLSSGARCQSSGGSCSANNNTCNIPRYPCRIEQAVNPCRETNACVSPANTCTAGPLNPCVTGPPSDTCDLGNNATSAIGMCRITLLKCQRDDDCPASGDSCGPATSRAVIAKRVLASIVSDNSSIVNFGLMTFYQSLYYPYYAQQSTGTQTASIYFTHGRLAGRDCFDKDSGPSQICVIDGITYTLAASSNSRYSVRGGGAQQIPWSTNWCGTFCNIPGQGTGSYRGSTYTYTLETGTRSSTVTMRPDYTGKQITAGGIDYRYYDSNPAYYNGGARPPIEVPQCGLTCSAKCGARWDTQLAPFLDPTGDPVKERQMVLAINDRLAPASYGGLITYGGTPTGCALRNDVGRSSATSAYDYMSAVKDIDTLPCRENFVLLITDGEANGPGDAGCGSSACAAANPRAAGCLCRAVLSAYDLRQNLGVRTFVIGFSGDVNAGAGRLTNDNIAKAGGSDRGSDGRAPYAFGATSEAELMEAIQDAIYDAVKGSYATSPPTMSSGTQLANGMTGGSYALDARADFPSWKGHLLAYDTNASPPVLAWDAAVELRNMDWKSRRIFTSDGSNRLVPISIDSGGNVTNKVALHGLGLGGNADEAALVARWLLGDPAQGSGGGPVLGAMVNSTPIDVGPPGSSPLPGGRAFYERHKSRPRITYVGADDGLLHAFWSQDQLVGGVARRGGSEAFAYLPPHMLPVVTRLYAQGGQVPDPRKHVFGLASSAKVKNLCVSACNDPELAVWKTVLIMTDGFGGNDAFTLDITDHAADPPFGVLWTTATSGSRSTFDAALGLTISVPAFFFNKTPALDDYRLMFASGYRVDTGSGGQGQGLSVLSVSAITGAVHARAPVSVPGASCGQEYTLLADVATARDHARNVAQGTDERQKLLAAYAGDTWGNLWRTADGAGSLQLATSLGCDHPLHVAPTVVQLDRDDPTNHAHEIYLVQVTNSPLDDATQGFPPSRMVLMRDLVDGQGNVYGDTSFGTGGKIVLGVGEAPRMCAVSDAAGSACLLDLPLAARPMATPLAVLKQDGSGFLALSSWYVPAEAGCGKGTTYMQIHQYTAGQVLLKQALKVGDEPVSSPIVVGGKIMVMSSRGPMIINGSILQSFVVGQSTPAASGTSAEPFKILGWTEL
jgi:hypothetical protein